MRAAGLVNAHLWPPPPPPQLPELEDQLLPWMTVLVEGPDAKLVQLEMTLIAVTASA
jgi:hypothetical protein